MQSWKRIGSQCKNLRRRAFSFLKVGDISLWSKIGSLGILEIILKLQAKSLFQCNFISNLKKSRKQPHSKTILGEQVKRHSHFVKVKAPMTRQAKNLPVRRSPGGEHDNPLQRSWSGQSLAGYKESDKTERLSTKVYQDHSFYFCEVLEKNVNHFFLSNKKVIFFSYPSYRCYFPF